MIMTTSGAAVKWKRRFRVYDPGCGATRLVGVFAARCKDDAIQMAAEKMGLEGNHAYLFRRVATAKMVKPSKEASHVD